MAAQKRFIQAEVDRTPYGALWGVSTLAAALLCAGIYGFWQLGARFHGFSWVFTPLHVSLPENTLDPVISARSAATNLQNQAEAAAKDAATKAVQDQVDSLKKGALGQ